MKMHLKIHEKAAFDLTNVLETENFENLTSLNQGGIIYANKPETIQSFIETHNRIENSTTTNDKMSNITRSKKRGNKTEKNTKKKCEKKSENNKTEKKTEKKMCEKKQESKTKKKCGKKRKNKNKKKTEKKKTKKI